MSNNIKKAIHPGFYLKEYIEELQMTQEEFANRLGISGKQISLILSKKASITADIAYKLSKLMDTSIEMWLNLQTKYDAYKVELENASSFEREKEIYKYVDKKFLVNLKIIDEEDKPETAIPKVRKASLVSSLTLHLNKDMLSYYRTSIDKDETPKNTVCKNVWVSLATSIAKNQEVDAFDEKKLKENINVFRSMTLLDPSVFYPRLKDILASCGVSLVILPTLKNSNINGVVKWLDSNKVMIALNTRGATNDKFWFSFFHELRHVLQQEKRKMFVGEGQERSNIELVLEYDADLFASETLIPSKELSKLLYYGEKSIINFARDIGVHPGIVVGRLQKLGKIKYSQLNDLKVKYEIVIDDNVPLW